MYFWIPIHRLQHRADGLLYVLPLVKRWGDDGYFGFGIQRSINSCFSIINQRATVVPHCQNLFLFRLLQYMHS